MINHYPKVGGGGGQDKVQPEKASIVSQKHENGSRENTLQEECKYTKSARGTNGKK